MPRHQPHHVSHKECWIEKDREKVQYNNVWTCACGNWGPEIMLRHFLRLFREVAPMADD
jgi:hypothetical protein